MQRFQFCRSVFNLGGADCSTAQTDSRFFVIPGAAAAAANPGAPIGPLVDEVSKGVVVGGIRFWLQWAINTDDIPSDYADLVTMATVMWWIAKVPIDPETLAPAWLPDPLQIKAGDRGQRENLLWTKLEQIPLGFNDGTTSTQILTSSGAWANRDTAFFTLSTNGTIQSQMPHKVRVKRTLSEFDALLFGVTSITGVNTSQQVPIVYDCYGQVAVKRSGNAKTGL